MNKIFAAVMLTCMLSSCTKNFQEMNTNPNTLVKVPYKNIIDQRHRFYRPGKRAGTARNLDKIPGQGCL